MKRSNSIRLTLLASAAAAITGSCSQKPPRRCVNAENKVVDESFCQDEDHRSSFYPYHWYYGGPRGYVPIGAFVNGGTTTPPRGGYSTPSGTSRGVIGGAGEAASGSHGAGAHGGGAGE